MVKIEMDKDLKQGEVYVTYCIFEAFLEALK